MMMKKKMVAESIRKAAMELTKDIVPDVRLKKVEPSPRTDHIHTGKLVRFPSTNTVYRIFPDGSLRHDSGKRNFRLEKRRGIREKKRLAAEAGIPWKYARMIDRIARSR